MSQSRRRRNEPRPIHQGIVIPSDATTDERAARLLSYVRGRLGIPCEATAGAYKRAASAKKQIVALLRGSLRSLRSARAGIDRALEISELENQRRGVEAASPAIAEGHARRGLVSRKPTEVMDDRRTHVIRDLLASADEFERSLNVALAGFAADVPSKAGGRPSGAAEAGLYRLLQDSADTPAEDGARAVVAKLIPGGTDDRFLTDERKRIAKLLRARSPSPKKLIPRK